MGLFLFLEGGENLLTITDINGNTEGLTGYKGLKRTRNVNGEKTLSFIVLPTPQNQHSFDLVQEESIIEFDGEEYRIKQMNEKPRGPFNFKEVSAIHTFFDLIDDYQYDTYTGSMTLEAALHFVLGTTEYTWDIVDSFNAHDFNNFGNDNLLSLFQNLMKNFGAEFILNGKHLIFKTKIGNATDFQFRYNYNIKTITKTVNTNNLSTYIKGFGKKNEDGTYVVQSEYTSPNSTIFGIRHAKPIYDERYTTMDGLNAALVSSLKDLPDVSITIDFIDLRRAGFPYDVPNEGDDIFLIYEPMNVDLETRIMEIAEEFIEFNDYPIKTDVTLANYRNNMTDSIVDFSRTSKTVSDIIEGNKKLPYNALDDAVKRATEALQSAQTELEFTNGIIARDKNNPNHLVLYNSSGIGVSTDGGQTFRTAMTAEGVAAELITAGTISGSMLKTSNSTNYVLVDDQFVRILENDTQKVFIGYYIDSVDSNLQPTILLGQNADNHIIQDGTFCMSQEVKGSNTAFIGLKKGFESDGITNHFPSNIVLDETGYNTINADTQVSLESKKYVRVEGPMGIDILAQDSEGKIYLNAGKFITLSFGNTISYYAKT
jgi:phage minor structural protein